MAQAIITDKRPGRVVRIDQENYVGTVQVTDTQKTVRINEILPFRIRFTSIGIEAGGFANTPPIPLQIIGYSNYIL
jgi:hypothetical protein